MSESSLPLHGPTKDDCPCGCGLFGALTIAHRNGERHVRGCKCVRCTGRNSKRSSGARERRVARRLGGERAPLSGALSGYDMRIPLRNGDWLYIEETTNQAFCRGLERWWGTKQVESKLSRLMHRRDGVRAVFTPGLVVMPRTDAETLIRIAGRDDE